LKEKVKWPQSRPLEDGELLSTQDFLQEKFQN